MKSTVASTSNKKFQLILCSDGCESVIVWPGIVNINSDSGSGSVVGAFVVAGVICILVSLLSKLFAADKIEVVVAVVAVFVLNFI